MYIDYTFYSHLYSIILIIVHLQVCTHPHAVNVVQAVGLSVGFFIFLVVCVGVPICIAVYPAAKKRCCTTVRTDTEATTPSEVTSVVTANQANDTSALITPPPIQQQAHKNAQFSSQEAPPSYSAAVAFPTYTGPPPQVMCWWLSVQIPSICCLRLTLKRITITCTCTAEGCCT